MKWTLQDKTWNAVAQVELPDDAPDIVIFEGQLFFYDERLAQYVTPTFYVVPSEPAPVSPHSEIRVLPGRPTKQQQE